MRIDITLLRVNVLLLTEQLKTYLGFKPRLIIRQSKGIVIESYLEIAEGILTPEDIQAIRSIVSSHDYTQLSQQEIQELEAEMARQSALDRLRASTNQDTIDLLLLIGKFL